MSYKIAIIGSTGVLGTKLLKFLNKNNQSVDLITCYSNTKKLIKQKKITHPNHALVLNPLIPKINNDLQYGDILLVKYIKQKSIDYFYLLDTGFESLKYINLIIESQINCTIAIANKEVLVAGGRLLINNIYKSGNKILPLDSEHFSLINLLPQRNSIKFHISKIYLTASGGPFYFDKNFNINNINLHKATSHPLWKMGFKNTIDSSNMVNKILECFELSSLYDFPLSKIGITVLPKGFAHSIIFYNDQRISINCFQNDMMIPMTSPFSNKRFYKNPNTNFKTFLDKDFNFMVFNNKNYQILKYLKELFLFSHAQQINFMILNAEAVNRFILNNHKYKDIIPFIFNNIDSFPKIKKFKNLYEIIKYTNMISKKISKL